MTTLHPHPQFRREAWLSLNGKWDFEIDFSSSGKEKKWQEKPQFSRSIMVPFSPESEFSGVHYTDFMEHVWYHRVFRIPEGWTGKNYLLHFEGVDYRCEIYLDGVLIGHHTGLEPFEAAFESAPGREHELTLWVEDLTRAEIQPRGKQCAELISHNCYYSRTTGIYRDVWVEMLPESALRSCQIVPDVDNGAFIFTPEFRRISSHCTLEYRIFTDEGDVVSGKCAAAPGVPVFVKLPAPRLWEPGNPFLYDFEFTLKDAKGVIQDQVCSYAGLRKIHIEGDRFFFNNKPIFLRFVLDQGFYPQGLWTEPQDEDLKRDIELSMKAGFNGARLHQKIFSERFHYWADQLGYLTWAEFPDWGMRFWHGGNNTRAQWNESFYDYGTQWSALVKLQRNHPSIIAWTPFNETCSPADLQVHERMISFIANLTRTLDPTRPVNDSSGYIHADSDIWSVHNYQQTAEALKKDLETVPVYKNCKEDAGYRGQPYVPDEFGGVRYVPVEFRKDAAANAWGYSNADDPRTAENRIAELTKVLVSDPRYSGYCYTQLTDIEQEQNGVYNYDRTEKFDMAKIRAIFSEKPEWSAY